MANSEANSEASVSGIDKDGGEYKGETVAPTAEGVAASHVEEPSPDSLKNTPTNIARLEDVIEHCKGRQKYHTQTRSPSDGEDIRWYFCKVPLAQDQLAASVPQAEIVGKSKYFRFGMRDSLALEASFLQKEEELLSVWWKEYAECSEGPDGSNITSAFTSDSQPKLSCSEASMPTQLHEEERVGVPVKGGLYEVDLARRHCFPVYWSGENRRVLRGHWFARKTGLDWLPLREDIAEQLEFAYRCQVWHRRTFQPSGLFAARIDLHGGTQGLHALFTGEDDTWEAWLVIDASGFSHVIGLRGNGVKLRRGFSTSGSLKPTQDELRQQKEEEMDDYCSQVPVHHLVFMVHGIGQRLEKANLVDDVGDFRNLTASLAERHLTSYQRNAQRVLFIPCQWRRSLKLSGESAVEDITLDGVRGLRVMLSATVHDVLYYMSPVYCQDIIDSVSNQLNRLYMKFIKRNPGYNGKVSIYGHSLGSVLSYDILCHQKSLSSSIRSLPAECVENDESVCAGNQSAQSEKRINQGNGETSNELANVMGCKEDLHSNSMVDDENSKNFSISVDSSPALDLEGNSPKTFGDQSLDESCVHYQQTTDSNERHKVSVVKEDAQKVGLGSSSMFSQDGKGPDVNKNVIGQIPDGDGKTLAEGVSDKDELINLLKKQFMADVIIHLQGLLERPSNQTHLASLSNTGPQVSALKARIVELETLDNSLISSGGWQDSSKGFLPGDRMVKDAARQSLSEKSSPCKNDSRKGYSPHVRYTKLEFKADTFFAVGSPLGVFLALRNIRIGIGKGQDYWQDERITEEMPACRQMFNIFHPFDPVAYRVEPLVCKEYIHKRPIIIPYHRGGKRLHIGFQEFREDLAARSQAIVTSLNVMKAKMVDVFQSRNKEKLEAKEDSEVAEERTYGSLMMERLTGSMEGQIDHVLQDKTFEHPYISAIGAHTNYWRDPDTALFILKHLYRDIPEEPDMVARPGSPGSSTNHKGQTGRIYQSDDIDEDLPLTFSDKSLIREFSRKVRKTMRKP